MFDFVSEFVIFTRILRWLQVNDFTDRLDRLTDDFTRSLQLRGDAKEAFAEITHSLEEREGTLQERLD